MKQLPINAGWQFVFGDRDWTDKPVMQTVDLPHDYIINLPRSPKAAGTGSNGYFGDGYGEYTKQLDIPADWAGRRVLLDIDGAYMNCEVSLNDQHLCTHPYGYTAILVELSDVMRPGEKNELKIVTQSRQPSTRWYSGGGLYRQVSLWVGEAGDTIGPWDVFITTPEVSEESATVKISVDWQTAFEAEIFDDSGESIGKTDDGTLVISYPELWDVDSPYLYTAVIKLPSGDTHSQTFGIRKIEIDAKNGMRLNGAPIKLTGGCIHHDNGCIGSAAFPRAEERKLQKLKSLGYNAIRSSHYPPSTALLDVCDRIGMLVLDETFDVWTVGKKPLDYHLYFADWWERDIESMVRRDRNHPCVFCYSIGNEIPERDGSSHGAEWAHKQREQVRKFDATRPITSALNNIFLGNGNLFDSMFDKHSNPIEVQNFDNDAFAERTEAFCKELDVVGYNYLLPRYAHDRVRFPERAIMGTETFADNTYDYWKATLANPNVIGDFIWTAVDYLGEAGIGRTFWEDGLNNGFSGEYPWALSYDADVDITGGLRPQSYYRQILWGVADGPFAFTLSPERFGIRHAGLGWDWLDVQPTWTYSDEYTGRKCDAYAYADADEVEFILNGKSLGRAKVEKLIAHMVVEYAPGTLEVVAYADGAETGRQTLRTSGKPASIALTADRTAIAADRTDLCYINIELRDANGLLADAANTKLTVDVSGAGVLQALGNADPKSEETYGTATRSAYMGKLLAVVRALDEPGTIKVRVSGDGLADACVEIEAK